MILYLICDDSLNYNTFPFFSFVLAFFFYIIGRIAQSPFSFLFLLTWIVLVLVLHYLKLYYSAFFFLLSPWTWFSRPLFVIAIIPHSPSYHIALVSCLIQILYYGITILSHSPVTLFLGSSVILTSIVVFFSSYINSFSSVLIHYTSLPHSFTLHMLFYILVKHSEWVSIYYDEQELFCVF